MTTNETDTRNRLITNIAAEAYDLVMGMPNYASVEEAVMVYEQWLVAHPAPEDGGHDRHADPIADPVLSLAVPLADVPLLRSLVWGQMQDESGRLREARSNRDDDDAAECQRVLDAWSRLWSELDAQEPEEPEDP